MNRFELCREYLVSEFDRGKRRVFKSWRETAIRLWADNATRLRIRQHVEHADRILNCY
jgi:hypothetical protein